MKILFYFIINKFPKEFNKIAVILIFLVFIFAKTAYSETNQHPIFKTTIINKQNHSNSKLRVPMACDEDLTGHITRHNTEGHIIEEYAQIMQEIVYRLKLFQQYPVPLSDLGKKHVEKIKDLQTKFIRSLSSEGEIAVLSKLKSYLENLRNPPFEWFESYFKRLNEFGSFSPTPAKYLGIIVHHIGVYKSDGWKICVTWGCSNQCDFCYVPAPRQVEYIPWPWLCEIVKVYEDIENGDSPPFESIGVLSDPLVDYFDPIYNKDFADVVGLFKLEEWNLMGTGGFKRGSIGERAAIKIRDQYPNIVIRLSISIARPRAREIGIDNYIEELKWVYSILKNEDAPPLTMLAPDSYVAYDLHPGDNTRNIEEIVSRIVGDKHPFFAPLYPLGRLPSALSKYNYVSEKIKRDNPNKRQHLILPRGVGIRDHNGQVTMNIRCPSAEKSGEGDILNSLEMDPIMGNVLKINIPARED